MQNAPSKDYAPLAQGLAAVATTMSAGGRPLDAIAEFDRKNAEIADWRRLQERVLPKIKNMQDYRETVAHGLNRAQVYLWEEGVANPSPRVVAEAHRLTFEEATHDAGQYRQVGQPVTFGGRNGAEAQRVKIEQARLHEEMADLLANSRTPQDSCAAIAFYHARFIGIHPFMDGNGRTGRSIMEAQGSLLGVPLKLHQITENKREYLDAVNHALDTNDIAPLAALVARGANVEWKHKGELVSASKIKSRPMLSLDDIRPLDEEREMARTGCALPLPSVRNQARDRGLAR